MKEQGHGGVNIRKPQSETQMAVTFSINRRQKPAPASPGVSACALMDITSLMARAHSSSMYVEAGGQPP